MATFSRSCARSLTRLYNLGTPAATTALLRNGASGIECLLVKKAHGQRFGGLHVFPGGGFEVRDEVSAADGRLDVMATALNTASREMHEETSLQLDRAKITLMSHWVPPQLCAWKILHAATAALTYAPLVPPQ